MTPEQWGDFFKLWGLMLLAVPVLWCFGLGAVLTAVSIKDSYDDWRWRKRGAAKETSRDDG